MALIEVSKKNPILTLNQTYMISVPGIGMTVPTPMKLLSTTEDLYGIAISTMFTFLIEKTNKTTACEEKIHLLETTCGEFWKIWESAYDYDKFRTRELFK